MRNFKWYSVSLLPFFFIGCASTPPPQPAPMQNIAAPEDQPSSLPAMMDPANGRTLAYPDVRSLPRDDVNPD